MNTVVKHLGIIPDGSRRWAKENNKSLDYAYFSAMQKLAEIFDAVFDKGVASQSIYCLSKENLSRKPTELKSVLRAEERLLLELLPPLCKKWNCSVHIAGQLSLLPNSYNHEIHFLTTETNKSRTKHTRRLYLLVAYNPWDELLYAINNAKTLSAQNIKKNLWVPDDIDLVVRTGYGKLISNFLPLQLGYAELVFIDKYFNDISPLDIIGVIEKISGTGKRLLGK